MPKESANPPSVSNATSPTAGQSGSRRATNKSSPRKMPFKMYSVCSQRMITAIDCLVGEPLLQGSLFAASWEEREVLRRGGAADNRRLKSAPGQVLNQAGIECEGIKIFTGPDENPIRRLGEMVGV